MTVLQGSSQGMLSGTACDLRNATKSPCGCSVPLCTSHDPYIFYIRTSPPGKWRGGGTKRRVDLEANGHDRANPKYGAQPQTQVAAQGYQRHARQKRLHGDVLHKTRRFNVLHTFDRFYEAPWSRVKEKGLH